MKMSITLPWTMQRNSGLLDFTPHKGAVHVYRIVRGSLGYGNAGYCVVVLLGFGFGSYSPLCVASEYLAFV